MPTLDSLQKEIDLIKARNRRMENEGASKKYDRKFLLAQAAKIISTVIFVYLVSLVGLRADYWQGYVICVYVVALMVFIRILFRKKLAVLKERMNPGPGIKGWDRVFWFFYNLFSLVFFFAAILDGGKYQWSGDIPLSVYVLGYAALLASTALIVWAMYVNPFFSTRVRIQSERGHRVITDGPYRFVRHPGYLAVFFLYPGMSVVLGSLWSLIIVFVIIVTVIIRAHLEDKTLQRELQGYKDYAKKVKYRLFPGVW